MSKINYHLHSCFSDGKLSPEEIVIKAKKAGFSSIALTDHNTVKGFPDFIKACENHGLLGFPGIEISTDYLGDEVHLLGYFNVASHAFQNNLEALNEFMDKYSNVKVLQNKSMVDKLSEDFEVSWEDFLEFCEKLEIKNINRVHIANYLIDKNIVYSIPEAFDDFIGNNSNYYVKKKNIPIIKAAELIHKLGGVSLVAHIGEYGFTDNQMLDLFYFCLMAKIEGFEVFHPSHSLDYENNLLKTISNFEKLNDVKLLVFVGSDFHGQGNFNSLTAFSSQELTFDMEKTLLEYSEKMEIELKGRLL